MNYQDYFSSFLPSIISGIATAIVIHLALKAYRKISTKISDRRSSIKAANANRVLKQTKYMIEDKEELDFAKFRVMNLWFLVVMELVVTSSIFIFSIYVFQVSEIFIKDILGSEYDDYARVLGSLSLYFLSALFFFHIFSLMMQILVTNRAIGNAHIARRSKREKHNSSKARGADDN